MTTFAFVHSPFLPAWTWQKVAEAIGERSLVIDYTQALRGSHPFYEAIGDSAAAQLDGPSILVAHSGAGALVPSIRSAASGSVCAAIFVDALLPHPDRSWFDTVPLDLKRALMESAWNGRAPKWPRWSPPHVLEALLPDPALRATLADTAPSVPVGFLEELAPATSDWDGEPFSSFYLQLSAGYEAEARTAAGLGWPVSSIEADHLAILTRPSEVAQALRVLRATQP